MEDLPKLVKGANKERAMLQVAVFREVSKRIKIDLSHDPKTAVIVADIFRELMKDGSNHSKSIDEISELIVEKMRQ